MRTLIITISMALSLGINSAKAASDELFIPQGYSDYGSPSIVELERPMDIVKDKLFAFPPNLEGAPRLSLKTYFDRGDRLIIDVVERGLLDDSIAAVNQRYAFQPNDQGKFIILWGYGYRHQCARGEEIDTWVTTPCP